METLLYSIKFPMKAQIFLKSLIEIVFEIGIKWQLELFLSNYDNKSSSKAGHGDDDYYFYDDAEDEDDFTDDVHKVNAVICME